ncbi:lysophospholipase, putative [Plasmodium chabaudi chabaudi]|uniref:Lysophospholipase, putative n=1 Tax=Plasmodium chabaudi chabaudi TaxID=31271 RepID=A0A4V0K5I7_PLACU|nr:lysophospholipase, putative [Plasmodium chabaudi chabaudi]VTZ67846.1 lysophospholipase, putative [Plasmodium chabaudi chabaudi]|eukprot:XP_740348.2 lysophospholipase, putative [Plasmodium chabaudi chabaudi]
MGETELDNDELRKTVFNIDGNPKVGHFYNKDGLLLKTYRWPVKKAAGIVLLLHGLKGHARFTYLKPNAEVIDNNEVLVIDDDNYYVYSGSWVEKFNQNEYSVYAMDLQGHGESEARKNLRGHFKRFNDLVDDVLQYMNQIQDEIANDNKIDDESYSIVPAKKQKLPMYIIGYSMGGNIALRILQILNKAKVKNNSKLEDTVIYAKADTLTGDCTNIYDSDNDNDNDNDNDDDDDDDDDDVYYDVYDGDNVNDNNPTNKATNVSEVVDINNVSNDNTTKHYACTYCIANGSTCDNDSVSTTTGGSDIDNFSVSADDSVAASTSTEDNVVASTSTEYNEVPSTSTEDNVVASTSTEDNVVVSTSTEDNEVPSTSTEDNVVASTSTEDNVVVSTSTEDNEVPSTSTEDNEVVSTSTEDNEVPSTSTEDNEVASTSTEDNEVPSTSTEDNVVASTSTEDNVVVSTSTEDNEVPSTSTEDNVVASTSTEDNVVVSTSTEDTVVPSTSTEDNAVASTSTDDNAIASTSTDDNLIASTSTEDNAVASTSTEDNAVASTSTEDNVVASTSTDDNAVASTSTEDNAVASTSTDDNAVASTSTEDIVVVGTSTDDNDKNDDKYNCLDKLNIKGCVSLAGMVSFERIAQPGTYLFNYVYLPVTHFLSYIAPNLETKSELPYKGYPFIDNLCKLDKYRGNRGVTVKCVYELIKAMGALNDDINYIPKDIPILFVHAKGDSICYYKGVEMFYDRLHSDNKELFPVDNMDHSITLEPGNEQVLEKIIKWLNNLKNNNKNAIENQE